MLDTTIPVAAAYCRRAIFEPNLANGRVATPDDLVTYRHEVETVARRFEISYFEPRFAIRITPTTTPEILIDAKKRGAVVGKIYPDNVTTGSEQGGIKDFTALDDKLACMEEIGMVLQVHAELPGASELEAEEKFIPIIAGWIKRFPNLKISIEHLSSGAMIDFILGLGMETRDRVGGSITPQHLVLTNDKVYRDGKVAFPHNYCKPVAKSASDQQAVVRAALSGDHRFWFGSDSAPHPRASKEASYPPKAGVWSGPVALPVLAEVFEAANRLDRLEAFTSQYAAEFYGWSQNHAMIELEKTPWVVPLEIDGIVPFLAGKTLAWQVKPL